MYIYIYTYTTYIWRIVAPSILSMYIEQLKVSLLPLKQATPDIFQTSINHFEYTFTFDLAVHDQHFCVY